MYDDYDLDYMFASDYAPDLEEYALDAYDLDEDYARDADNYESLAYRHYAWYNLDTHTSGVLWSHKNAVYALL